AEPADHRCPKRREEGVCRLRSCSGLRPPASAAARAPQERRAGCPAPGRRDGGSPQHSSGILRGGTRLGRTMIGKPQDGLHAGQFPYSVTNPQAREERRPVQTPPVERKRLWAKTGRQFQTSVEHRQLPRLAIGWVQVREEGSSMAMMRTNEPEDEIGIICFGKARKERCQPHRTRLVTPFLRQTGCGVRRARQGPAGLGENLLRVGSQRIPTVEPRLKSPVSLASVVQKTGKLQVRDTRVWKP